MNTEKTHSPHIYKGTYIYVVKIKLDGDMPSMQ